MQITTLNVFRVYFLLILKDITTGKIFKFFPNVSYFIHYFIHLKLIGSTVTRWSLKIEGLDFAIIREEANWIRILN